MSIAPLVVRHPAKFSAAILDRLAELVPPGSRVIDPFAGTGKVHTLADLLTGTTTVGVEIEPEWAAEPVASRASVMARPSSFMADIPRASD